MMRGKCVFNVQLFFRVCVTMLEEFETLIAHAFIPHSHT